MPGSFRSRKASFARVAIPLGLDLASLLLSGLLAYLMWALAVRGQPLSVYLPAAPLLALIVVGYAQAGLYPGLGLGPVETLRRYWLVTGSAFVGIAALTFALKSPDRYSRMTLGLAAAFSLVLVPVGRWVLRRLTRRLHWWKEPIVLVGRGPGTRLAMGLLAEPAGWDYRLVGVLADADPHSGEPGAPVLGGLEAAPLVAARGIRVALAAPDVADGETFFDRLRPHFSSVIVLREYEDLPVEGVQVRNFGGILGLEYSNNLLRPQARWVKRALDIGLSAVALALAVPIILLALLVVKIASPGPALFMQDREGRNGRTIRVPKIRTMVPDAEAQVERVLRRDPALRKEWEERYKLPSDPRLIPGVGRFLRRWSIDELPQLWSVLRGDMSLVGPRPFPAYHLESVRPHARGLRAQVRPGLTGLWQVAARGLAGVAEQEAYDLYYIRNWSLWLDLYILGRTVVAVASGKGAY